MKRFTLIILSMCFYQLYSQRDDIDSIKQVIPEQEPIDQVNSYNELSWQYKNFDLDSSLYFARSAIAISKKEKSQKALSESFNSLANTYSAIGLFDSALVYHQKSFKFKKQMNDTLGMANSLNNQGIVYDESGNYAESLKAYFRALELYEKGTKDPYNVAMVLGNIGIVYKKQKEYQKVIEYYQKALSIYEEVGSDFGIMVTKGNLGSVALQLKNYEQAIRYSQEAKEAYEKAGYTRYIPYMIHNTGIAEDSLGNTLKARELYLQAIKGHAKHENIYELASSHVTLASNYCKTKEYRLAKENAEQALAYAEKINSLEFQSKSLFQLSKSLAGLGEYKKAYTYNQAYNSLQDSLFEDKKTKQIFELQTQYETEKKEQQIALQQAEISEQETELKRRQTLLFGSVLLIIAIVALAITQRSRLKKKQQIKLQEAKLQAREAEINATISSQEKERARYARDLHDGFGQMISILNMNIGSLKKDAKPAERQKVFSESEKVIEEMYDELKSICFDLMPQTLIKNGLQSALQEFASRINTTGKVFVETSFFGLEDRLNEIQEISLYRISQEWINNILKYSNAEKIILQITKDEDEITLLVEDDGQGFDKNLLKSGKGNGWKNLNTRTNLIKGELELETVPGKKGNVLIVNAPSIIKTDQLVENTVKVV